MVFVALAMATIMVVNPAQQARAVWPVVAWGVAALARSALPNIATRAGLASALVPARAWLIAHGVPQMAVNAAALGLGLVPLGMMLSQDEPMIELGAEQDDLDQMDEYVAGLASAGGLPYYVASNSCYFEISAIRWENLGLGLGQRAVLTMKGGPLEGWAPSWSEELRYSSCAATPSVFALFVHPDGRRELHNSTASKIRDRTGAHWVETWSHQAEGQRADAWIEHVQINARAASSYLPATTEHRLLNIYQPNGDLVNGTLPDGYWGQRECVPEGGGESLIIRQQGQYGIPIPGPCPEGYYSAGYGVWQGDPANGGVELFAVESAENWNLNADGTRNYSGCLAADGHSPNGLCDLSVTVDGRQCAYGVVGCAGWMHLVQSNPERVTCYWGSYSMPWTDCLNLAYAYTTPAGVQVPQMIGGNDPGLIPVYNPDGTPMIGPDGKPIEVPAPIETPGGDPWVDPGNNPPPMTDPPGSGTIPLNGTNPSAGPMAPVAPREDLGACMGGMWTWNPMDWVAVPMKCVFEWAFVPRPQYTENVGIAMDALWRSSSLGSLVSVLGDGIGIVAGGNGCMGPNVNIDIYGAAYDGYPLSACEEPMRSVADWSRLFTMVSAWVFAMITAARSVAGVFGFTGPTGGGVEA